MLHCCSHADEFLNLAGEADVETSNLDYVQELKMSHIPQKSVTLIECEGQLTSRVCRAGDCAGLLTLLTKGLTAVHALIPTLEHQ